MKNDLDKTKEQLVIELNELRQKSKEHEELLEASNQPTYNELEKKIYELEKSKSELKLNFKRAQKLSLIGSWDWDPNSDKVSYTDMILEIFGLNEKDFEGDFASMLASLVHPDDKAKVDAAAEKAKATGIGSDVTYRVIRPDGEIRWIHSLGESIFENGKFIKVIGTNQDVTAVKKTEEKLNKSNHQLNAKNQQLEATEQQLRATTQMSIASEKKFRSYIENAPDGIFIANEKGEYIEVNKSACNITGYNEKELLTLTIPELIQKEYLENAGNQFRILNEKGSSKGELGYLTKKGEKRFWSIDAVKLSNTRLLGFVKDITEHKLAEHALKVSEKTLKEAQEIAKIGYWTYDVSNTMDKVFWDENSCTIHDIKFDDFDQKPEAAQEFLHPDDREYVLRTFQKMITQKESIPFDSRIITKKGILKHLHVMCSIILNENGDIDKIKGIFQDITISKNAEEALKKSEEKFRNIFENKGTATGIFKEDGIIRDCNTKFIELSGYQKDEIIGKMNWSDFVLKEDLEKMLESFSPLLKKENPQPLQFESRMTDKVGKIIDIIINIAVSGTDRVVSLTDITERKQAEEALKNNEEQLRNIFENSTNIYYSHDTDHVVNYISPQIEDLLGYTPEEVMIKWTELASDNPMNEIGFKNTVKAIETGKRQPVYELEFVRKDGKKNYC